MIRFTIFFIIIVGFGFFANWISNYSGLILFQVGDYEVRVTLTFFIFLFALCLIITIIVWAIIMYIYNLPKKIKSKSEARINRKIQNSITKGLIHTSAGNSIAADLEIKKIDKLTSKKNVDIITLILKAQNANLKKDNTSLLKIFNQMQASDEAKMLGYRGLYTISKNSKNPQKSIEILKEAETYDRDEPWVLEEMLKCFLMTKNWVGACEALDSQFKNKLISKKKYNKEKAIILTAHAKSIEEEYPDESLELSQEANRLDKAQIISALISARVLSEKQSIAKAEKIILDTWKLNPHEDLALLYSHLVPGLSPSIRLGKVQSLIKRSKSNGIESAIALSRIAIEAKDYKKAREALDPHINDNSSKRTYQIMADIEIASSKNLGKAREWMRKALNAKFDTNWHYGDFVSHVWLPCIPETGELRVFEWGDKLINSIDENDTYIDFLNNKRLIEKNTENITQSDDHELDLKTIESDITETILDKDTKLTNQKKKKRTKSAKKEQVVHQDIINSPDNPGVQSDEDINEL